MEWAIPYLLGMVAVIVAMVAALAIVRLDARREKVERTAADLSMARRLTVMIEVKASATYAYVLSLDSTFLAEEERIAGNIASILDTLKSRPGRGGRVAGALSAAQAEYFDAFGSGMESGIGESGLAQRAEFLKREMGPLKSRLDSTSARLTGELASGHWTAIIKARNAADRGLSAVWLTCLTGLLLASAAAAGHHRRLQRARRQRDRYLERLRGQRELLAAVTGNVSRALIFLDGDGRCTFMNPAAEALTGFSRAEAMGEDIHRIMHPSKPDGGSCHGSSCALALGFRARERQRGEDFIRRKDGSTIPIAFTSSPIREGGGREGMVLEAEDISRLKEEDNRRKEYERALQTSDERFHILARATNDAVYDWDIRSGSIWWNEGVRTLFGFNPGQEGHDFAWWTSRIHPEDRDRMVQSLANAIDRESGTWHEEYRFLCANGEYKVVYDRGFIIREVGRGGACLRMIGAMMDVTAMRKAEEDLRTFNLLVEESNDYIALVDMEGRCYFLNAGGRRMVGVPLDLNPPAQSTLDYIFAEDRERAEQVWTKAVNEGRWLGEIRLQHRVTGKSIPVLWNLFTLKRAGNPMAFALAAVGRDLTHLREKEEQIRQGQKLEAIGHLAGGIAHDFNNILTVINGYGELLLRKFRPDDPDRGYLVAMLDSGRWAATLTAQLLAYGRKQVLQPRILDLNGVVLETADMLRRLIGEDIELRIRTKRHLEKVKADPVQLNQILLNLSINARDAMSEMPPIRVGGTERARVLFLETGSVMLEGGMNNRYNGLPPGRYVTLTVTDTGTGMPPEVQDHLFEPFFSTKSMGGGPFGRTGTGLGLSSTFGIIRQS